MRRCLVPPARVLVRMPSWLGDFVMAEPVVRALHERWSHANCADRITLVGPARFLALLSSLEADGVRFVPLERGATPDVRVWRGHDVALLLDGSWRSAWAAFRARIRERAGFASGGRTALLTQWIVPARERGGKPLGIGLPGSWPRRLPRPFTSACVELAAACALEVKLRSPILTVDEAARERVRARIGHGSRGTVGVRRVLVHAGSRPDSAKGVPAEQWAGILRSMGDADIVLTCGPGEEANARNVKALVPSATLLDDPPLDVAELLAAHELADVVLTSDSGPRHLSQASGVPTFVLCGPTDPRHTSDHDTSVHVLRTEVACGPCHLETCPLAGERRRACMTGIDARPLMNAFPATEAKLLSRRISAPTRA